MKGDFSRNTFNPKKHYRSVLKQQGRVDVDADWNEQQAINMRRIETEATDVIGGCGAPKHDAGFHVVTDLGQLKNPEENNLAGNTIPQGSPITIPLPAGDFLISAGRYYVDGILCENEQIVTYTTQPDLPAAQVMDQSGFYVVYLDVWQRHITALDDPSIREKALGGPDTATRLKTIWQVKVLPVQLAHDRTAPTCDTEFIAWDNLIAPSTGTLDAQTQPPDPTEQPCLLPPSAGYQRLENQLYRVEIHKVNADGTPASFVWSRDNGTVVTAIKSISGNNVVVADVGPDDVLGFANGQWVEIVDDTMELNGRPGQLSTSTTSEILNFGGGIRREILRRRMA
ncbi:MAG: DUF6519 domain-containing protein [Verrucomicrobia bacterium]|nr:DUF6519 domain-containing protein [Verrucomicrobiota bacterium]